MIRKKCSNKNRLSFVFALAVPLTSCSGSGDGLSTAQNDVLTDDGQPVSESDSNAASENSPSVDEADPIDTSQIQVRMVSINDDNIIVLNTQISKDRKDLTFVCTVPTDLPTGTFEVGGSYQIENYSKFTSSLGGSHYDFKAKAPGINSPHAVEFPAYPYTRHIDGEFAPFWENENDPDEVIITFTCKLNTLSSNGLFELSDSGKKTFTILKNTAPHIIANSYFKRGGSTTQVCSLPDCDFGVFNDLYVNDQESDDTKFSVVAKNNGCGEREPVENSIQNIIKTTPTGVSPGMSLTDVNTIEMIEAELNTLPAEMPFYRRYSISAADDYGLSEDGEAPFDFYVCPAGKTAAVSNTSGSCGDKFICVDN